MSKYCPIMGEEVVYLSCLECLDKRCQSREQRPETLFDVFRKIRIEHGECLRDRSTETGRQNFDKMMNDLMDSDAAFDRAVSDNMSAYFKNDPEVVQRYFNEGVDYYQHDDNYWARSGNREAEIYANSFSMMAQDNKASCEFMEQYFPNTWEQFKKTL